MKSCQPQEYPGTRLMLHLEIVKSVYFTEKLYKSLLGAIVFICEIRTKQIEIV